MAHVSRSLLPLFHLAPSDQITARRILADVTACYRGEQRGFLPCAAPYSNLEHILATALAAGRIVDGCHKSGEIHISSSTALAVLAGALLHDIGFLRRGSEQEIPEGAFTFRHVERGRRFAEGYLTDLGCPRGMVRAVCNAINATALYRREGKPHGGRPADMHVAAIVAAADVLAQAAVEDIVQAMGRLWEELRAAYTKETEEFLAAIEAPRFKSFPDLLLNILEFYDTTLAPRLDDPAGFYRFLPLHFGSEDHLYRTAIRRNYETLLQSRSLLLGVTEHLFTARSLRDLVRGGLPHLRRLLRAKAIVLGTGTHVLADPPEESDLPAALRHPSSREFLTQLPTALVLHTVEEMELSPHPLPAVLVNTLYPLLLRASVAIHPLGGERHAVLILVSSSDRRRTLEDAAHLLTDLGPGIALALRNAEERSQTLPAEERLKDLLLAHGIDPSLADILRGEALRTGRPLPLLLAERSDLDAETAGRLTATAAGLPFRRLVPRMAEGLESMPSVSRRYLRRHRLTPVTIGSDTAEVAVADPFHDEPMAAMQRLFPGKRLRPFVAPAADIDTFLDHLFGPTGASTGPLLQPAEIESLATADDEGQEEDQRISPDDHIVVRRR